MVCPCRSACQCKQNIQTLIDFGRLCFIVQQLQPIIRCILESFFISFFRFLLLHLKLFFSFNRLFNVQLTWTNLSNSLSSVCTPSPCLSSPPLPAGYCAGGLYKPVMVRGIIQNLTWDSKQSLGGWHCTLIGDNNHQFINGTPYLPPGPRMVLLATKQHGDTSIFLPLPPLPLPLLIDGCFQKYFVWVCCAGNKWKKSLERSEAHLGVPDDFNKAPPPSSAVLIVCVEGLWFPVSFYLAGSSDS